MVGFRITKDFKSLLEKHAKRENKTLSSFLIDAILFYLDKKYKVKFNEPREVGRRETKR